MFNGYTKFSYDFFFWQTPMIYLKSMEMYNIIYWCLLQFDSCVEWVKSLFLTNSECITAHKTTSHKLMMQI